MADLRTDYKDDVLDTSVNEKRKYRMITNDDGTVSFEDVTEYLQVGDSFGSADINETNKKINIEVLESANVLEITEQGTYFIQKAEGLPSNRPQSSGRTGYLFVFSCVLEDGAERRTITWVPYASSYAWYNTYYGVWDGWKSSFPVSIATSSEITWVSSSMWHHMTIMVQNDVIEISTGINVTAEIPAYGTVLTIPDGKRGTYNKGVSIISTDGSITRLGFYDHTSGSIKLLGVSLPVGYYFIMSS